MCSDLPYTSADCPAAMDFEKAWDQLRCVKPGPVGTYFNSNSLCAQRQCTSESIGRADDCLMVNSQVTTSQTLGPEG